MGMAAVSTMSPENPQEMAYSGVEWRRSVRSSPSASAFLPFRTGADAGDSALRWLETSGLNLETMVIGQ